MTWKICIQCTYNSRDAHHFDEPDKRNHLRKNIFYR